MANTGMSFLYPEFWAAGFDGLDAGQYNLQNFASRSVESKLANAGDTVNVPITPDFGAAADWTPGATITPSAVTQTQAQVSLNKSKQVVKGFTDAELSLSAYDLIQNYATPMAKSILQAVNLDLYLELMKTPYFVNAMAGISEDFIADAGTKLSENEVGLMDRRLVGSPGMIGALRKIDVFRDVDTNGTNSIIRDGRITRQYGFDIYENNIISKYTPADVAGAVNNKGTAYAAGATTIAVDAFNDDARPVRVGDVFVIADETGTPLHTVTGTTQSSGDTVSITFTPAIVDGAADDAVVTITPTQSLLAFVPGAMAFAARAYAAVPKPGAQSTVIDVQGLPVRITTWVDSATLNLNVAYDILYGMTMVNPKRCVRVLEDA
jgi:hypothetical protein